LLLLRLLLRLLRPAQQPGRRAQQVQQLLLLLLALSACQARHRLLRNAASGRRKAARESIQRCLLLLHLCGREAA
jgi:hypothetical protein